MSPARAAPLLATLAWILCAPAGASSHRDAPLISCPVLSGDVLSSAVRSDLDLAALLSRVDSVAPLGKTYKGGLRCATADFTGDGVADIVVAPGPGVASVINTIDGATLERIDVLSGLKPFGLSYSGGIQLTAGDVDGDGTPDIVAARERGAPRVIVLDGGSAGIIWNFNAYATSFTGGVRVAAGDVTGDGLADIVTAPGPGTGGLRVRVFDGATVKPVLSITPYSADFAGGIHVGVGDVNGDGRADIVTAPGSKLGPRVRIFSGPDGVALRAFDAYAADFRGGVTVAASDFNGDGLADVVTGVAAGGKPVVRLWDGASGLRIAETMLFGGRPVGVQVAADYTRVSDLVPAGATGFQDLLPRFGERGFTVEPNGFDGCVLARDLLGTITRKAVSLSNLPDNGPIAFNSVSPGVFEGNGITMFQVGGHFGRLTFNGCRVQLFFSNTSGGQCSSEYRYSAGTRLRFNELFASAFANCPPPPPP